MTANPKSNHIVFFVNILRKGAGMINRNLGMAKALTAQGGRISFLRYFRPCHQPDPATIPVYTILKTRYLDRLYGTALAFVPASVLIAWKLLRLRPDILCVDLPHEAFWALLFRPLFKYRIVFTYHGMVKPTHYDAHSSDAFERTEHRRLKRLTEQHYRYLARVDHAVVVSDFLRRELAGQGIESVVIYNGFDPDLINSTRQFKTIQGTGPVAISVGRYARCKGLLDVVKAFALVAQAQEDAELILYAVHEEKQYYQEILDHIEAHKLSHRVHLFGPIEFESFSYMVSLCSVFVTASLYESFGMPLLEAQACSVPCVSYAVGGVPEVVKDQVTGLLVEAGNVEALAQSLERLLTDATLHEQLTSHMPEHLSQFTYAKLASDLGALFERLTKP